MISRQRTEGMPRSYAGLGGEAFTSRDQRIRRVLQTSPAAPRFEQEISEESGSNVGEPKAKSRIEKKVIHIPS